MIVNGALTNHFSSIKSECSDQLRLDFLLRFCCSVNLAGRRAPKIFSIVIVARQLNTGINNEERIMTIVWALRNAVHNFDGGKKLNYQFAD